MIKAVLDLTNQGLIAKEKIGFDQITRHLARAVMVYLFK